MSGKVRQLLSAGAVDFHGRERLVRRLTEAMDRRTDSRLVVVAGPSGSGKSSVLGAGLTPALRAEGWSIATMYPGGSPLEIIERTVASLESAPSVVIVDQLEELITVASEETREPFLDELAELATRPEGPWVVVAVRADFLDRLLVHPRFARLVEPALVLVTPLEDHEVRDVIVGPASSTGVSVEPDLVAAMVRDVGRSAAALPLLEYALTHPDEILTRERLLDAVWGWDYPVGTRAVDTRVAELRRVLDDDPSNPRYIETVPGVGYRFVGAVESA